MKIKSALRQARELRGWSQAKIAQSINADVGTVSRWERHITAPSPYFREQLCELFGMDAQALGFLEPEAFVQDETVLVEYEQSGAFFMPTDEGPIIDPLIPRPVLTYTNLVGRDALLKDLTSLLCSGTTCALFGLPGVGKTALALTLVHDQAIHSHFADGILWVGLGPSPDIYNCLLRWATLLGVPASMFVEHQTTESLSRILRQAIGHRRLLLVIDDAWTVDESCLFLVGGPYCAQLVTTRSPQLAHTIAGHRAISVPVLSHQESFHLLTTLVPDLSQMDDKLIAPLIQQVGGLPFLLYMIGKNLQVEASSGQFRRLYTALSHLSERSARLQLAFPLAPTERPPALTEGVPPSLETLITHSVQRLSSAAHDGLQSLSLLPPQPASFSEETALAVAAVSVDVLDELLDAGLLESHTSGRYTLHQTIADYILHHGQPTQEARERFINHCIEYVLAHSNDFAGLKLECPVILNALEEAYRLEHYHALVRGTCAIAEFLCWQEMHALAERYLSYALTAADSIADLRSKGLIFYHQGELANMQGQHLQAYACYEEGLQLARQLQDHELQKKLLRCLNRITLVSGPPGSAEESVEVNPLGDMSVEVNYLQCPFCKNCTIQKRGKTNAGTQRYYCRNCRRSFIMR